MLVDSILLIRTKITGELFRSNISNIASMRISPNPTANPKPKSPIRRLFKSRPSSPRVKSPVKSVGPLHCNLGGNEVEKVFRYIDENGDGRISAAELQSCIRSVAGGTAEVLTDEEAEAAVKGSDSDGDGYLSLADLERIMAATEVPEEERTEELKEAFAMYEETAGSGCITPRSLKMMLSRLGDSKSVRDCEVMISRYDLNGDGVISFDEFAAMMR